MERPQALTRSECLELLGRSSLGRVAFTERALPAIRPVGYALVGHQLVLRIEAGELGHRLDGQVVAFEVDEIDSENGTGWSVVVTGAARLLRMPGELMRDAAAPSGNAARDGRDCRVCIVPGEITGRAVRFAHGAA